jgi:hypothetical protein
MLVDSLFAVAWVVVNGFLGYVAWRWSRWWHPFDSVMARIGHAILLAWALITAVGTGLGLVGLLGGETFLASVFVVTGIGYCLLPRPHAGHSPFHIELNHWSLSWLLVGSLMIGHAVMRGIFTFPSLWDTLGYHLPLVDAWLQAQSLYAPDNSHWSVPGNLELFGVWFVAPFSGDFWIGLTNIPVTALLLLSTYQLGRAIELEETWAQFAALATAGNAIVWAQLISLENDVATAALFVACLFYSLRYARRGEPGDLLFAGIAVGLLTGVKFYAPGYAAVATAAAFAWAKIHRRPLHPILIIWTTAIFLLGAYWYLRNSAITGSPLFPMMMSGHEVVISEDRAGAWRSSFLGNGNLHVILYGLHAAFLAGGPCVVAIILLFPLALMAGIGTMMFKNRSETIVCLATVLAAVAVFLITPNAVEAIAGTLDQLLYEPRTAVRYALSVQPLITILVAMFLQRWGGSGPRIIATAVIVAQYAFVLVNPERGLTSDVSGGMQVRFPETYLVAGNLLLVGAILYFLRQDYPALVGRMIRLAPWAGVLGFAIATHAVSQRWHADFVSHYDGMFQDTALSNLGASVPAGAKVCVMDARPYPFFGDARQYRVCQPVRLPSADALFAFLDERDIDYLVIRSDRNPFPETIPEHRLAAEALAAHATSWQIRWRGPVYALYQRERVK